MNAFKKWCYPFLIRTGLAKSVDNIIESAKSDPEMAFYILTNKKYFNLDDVAKGKLDFDQVLEIIEAYSNSDSKKSRKFSKKLEAYMRKHPNYTNKFIDGIDAAQLAKGDTTKERFQNSVFGNILRKFSKMGDKIGAFMGITKKAPAPSNAQTVDKTAIQRELDAVKAELDAVKAELDEITRRKQAAVPAQAPVVDNVAIQRELDAVKAERDELTRRLQEASAAVASSSAVENNGSHEAEALRAENEQLRAEIARMRQVVEADASSTAAAGPAVIASAPPPPPPPPMPKNLNAPGTVDANTADKSSSKNKGKHKAGGSAANIASQLANAQLKHRDGGGDAARENSAQTATDARAALNADIAAQVGNLNSVDGGGDAARIEAQRRAEERLEEANPLLAQIRQGAELKEIGLDAGREEAQRRAEERQDAANPLLGEIQRGANLRKVDGGGDAARAETLARAKENAQKGGVLGAFDGAAALIAKHRKAMTGSQDDDNSWDSEEDLAATDVPANEIF